MPPHKLKDLEKATFSNIEQQSIDYVTTSLMPHLTAIEQAASAKHRPWAKWLLTRYGWWREGVI